MGDEMVGIPFELEGGRKIRGSLNAIALEVERLKAVTSVQVVDSVDQKIPAGSVVWGAVPTEPPKTGDYIMFGDVVWEVREDPLSKSRLALVALDLNFFLVTDAKSIMSLKWFKIVRTLVPPGNKG